MSNKKTIVVTQDQALNANALYQLYLKMVKLNQLDMTERQRIETKRAFMGAFGLILEGTFPTIAAMTESDAVKALDSLREQVEKYWNNQNLMMN